MVDYNLYNFNIFVQMYIPLLTTMQMSSTGSDDLQKEDCSQKNISNDGEEEISVKSSGKFMLRDELLHRTHKFLGVVNTTLQRLQIEG